MRDTFVLIHGSWHGGWAWERVAAELAREGRSVHAPTLAGHGPGAARAGITHQDCVAGVVAVLQREGLHDVTLVGHSFGGTVVQRVAVEHPELVRRMIFLDALILENGQCVADTLPEEYVALFEQLSRASADGSMLIPWEIWRESFIQDAPEPLARQLWSRLSPEPNQVNLDRLPLRRFQALDVPRSFIFCRQDRALPHRSFHPIFSSRLGTFKLVEMDGGHEVMFTRPAELAAKILEASTD